jgi:hypothetical protein
MATLRRFERETFARADGPILANVEISPQCITSLRGDDAADREAARFAAEAGDARATA